MSPPPPPARKSARHFTPFFSVAEEAIANRKQSESGHMNSMRGRLVRTPGAELPYKVMLTHDGRAETAHAFATVREAEEFIRRNTPVPPVRSTLRDHDAGQDSLF